MRSADELRAAVLEAVREHGPIRLRDLARKLGESTRTVASYAESLAAAGKVEIERPGGGYRAGERVVRLPGADA